VGAVAYSGIRDEIKGILEGDARTAGAKVFIEEDPQFGLADEQQVIFICLDRRTAPPAEQRLAAGMRTQYHLQCVLVTAYFSMESFKAACDGRDALLGQMELVLMANRTIGGKANSSWLEGGEMFSVRNPGSNVWAAVAETSLIIDVEAVNT
jgi:hypothetical protein